MTALCARNLVFVTPGPALLDLAVSYIPGRGFGVMIPNREVAESLRRIQVSEVEGRHDLCDNQQANGCNVLRPSNTT